MTTATAPSLVASALASVLASVLGCLPRVGTFVRAAPSQLAAPTHLLPGQVRTLHAAEGMHLQVLGGRLWLTQPGADQDVFLTAGDTLALTQDWVVIQADAMPDAPPRLAYAAYRLVPL